MSPALLGPLEWLIIAPVLGFLPAKDMSPDIIRGVLATVALFFVVRDTDETPLRAAVALPLSPLRLTIDDEQLPVRVARRYDEDSVIAARGARRARSGRDVVMSNLYAHGIAQPYARDAFVRLASAAALTPEELYGDPAGLVAARRRGPPGRPGVRAPVAAVLAAGSSYAVEQAIIAPWRLAAPSETEIEACAKAEKYFQVTAPPERAGRAPRPSAPRRTDGATTAAPTSGALLPRCRDGRLGARSPARGSPAWRGSSRSASRFANGKGPHAK